MFNPNNPLPAAFLPPTPWNFVCGCILWLVEVRAGVDKEDSQDEIKKAGSWKEHLPAWKTVTLKLSFTPKSIQGFHYFLFSKSSIHQNTTPGIRLSHANAHISPIATGHVAWPPRSKSATWELQTFYSGVCCCRLFPLTSSIVIVSFCNGGQPSTWMTRRVARNFRSKKIKEFEEEILVKSRHPIGCIFKIWIGQSHHLSCSSSEGLSMVRFMSRKTRDPTW